MTASVLFRSLATNDGLLNFHHLDVEEIKKEEATYLWSLVEMPNGHVWGASFKDGREKIHGIWAASLIKEGESCKQEQLREKSKSSWRRTMP